jgi:phosphoglycolate phosphatase
MGVMRSTVLLYDIDGTLISTAGVGRLAIERTFGERFGRSEVLDFPFDGMTDPAIVGRGLRALGVAEELLPVELQETLAAYLRVLTTLCQGATNFRVHAGVEEALALTADRKGFSVGLGTGNLADGARLKLEPVGLYRHFSFGGFGSDHVDRGELLRIGAERGAERLGVPRAECRVVVIGDTPKDIAAAQAIGAECIGVATGSFSVEQLRAHGATHSFANLADSRAASAILGE